MGSGLRDLSSGRMPEATVADGAMADAGSSGLSTVFPWTRN